MSSSHEILSYVPTTSKGSTLAASTGTLSLQLPWKWHPRFFVQALNIQHVGTKKIGVQDFVPNVFFQRCDFQVPMFLFEGAGKDFAIAGFFNAANEVLDPTTEF